MSPYRIIGWSVAAASAAISAAIIAAGAFWVAGFIQAAVRSFVLH